MKRKIISVILRQIGIIIVFYILMENINSPILWKKIGSIISFTMVFIGIIGIELQEYRKG